MLIPTQVCKNVGKVAAKETTRYAIDGVLLERRSDHCLAAATDGRMLLRARWSDADHAEYPAVDGLNLEPQAGFKTLIPSAELADVAKMPPRRPTRRILGRIALDEHTCNGSATFKSTDLSSVQTREVKTVEGHFPMYEDVIPRYRIGFDAIEIGVSPELLIRLLTAMAGAATSDDNRGVRLVVPIRPSSPIFLESRNNEVQATGVLMPVGLEKPCSDKTPIRHAEELAAELGRMVQLVERMEQKARTSPHVQARTVLATDEVVQVVNTARYVLEKSGCSVPAPFDDGAVSVKSDAAEAAQAA